MNHRAREQDEPAIESPSEASSVSGKLSSDKWLRRAIDQHEHLLVRYAHQFVGDVERARDVVQDAFLKLCDQERKREPDQERLDGRSLTKWLYKVCRNRAIDVSRKEKRMKSAPPHEFEEQLDAEASSPDAAALEQERHVALLQQIATLPINQQEVLRLKFHGGLSYQEIAEVTGLSRTNVGYLLHKAISKLRQNVAGEL